MGNKRKTNIEAVVDLMEFSRYGPLAQLFVVDALSKHARHVADAPVEAFAGMRDGMINQEAWQGVAREIAQKMDAHLGCSAAAPAKTVSAGSGDVIGERARDLDEDEIADWLSRQIEDGAMKLEDIPRLMARYALADPKDMKTELGERMEMYREESASPRM